MIDLTPIYPLIPAKDKVIVPGLDYQMGTQLGGQVLASDARYWGEGESIGVMDEHGLYIGSSDYLTAPFYVSMAGDMIASSLTITGGTIRSGKTSFTDSANAGYYLGSEGLYVGSATDTTKLKYTLSTGAFDFIGTISSRATGIIASAISSTGHFIDDALNTSAKTILDSFTFGASGALQIGTYSAGVSGDLKISPTGILGRDKDNNTTFTIDATTGDATFAGTLSAAAGTLGTITSANITAGTFQTAATGQRIVTSASDNYMKIYSSTAQVGALGSAINEDNFLMDWSVTTDTSIARFATGGALTSPMNIYSVNSGLGINTYLRCLNTSASRTQPVLLVRNAGYGPVVTLLSGANSETALQITPNGSGDGAAIRVDRQLEDYSFQVARNGDTIVGDLTGAGKGYLHIKGDDDSDNDPGCLVLYDHSGTPYYLWVSTDGELRIHTSAPTAQSTDGTVVGTQT